MSFRKPKWMGPALVLLIAMRAYAASESVLYNFADGSDGAYPIDYGHLARDSSGSLYGTTAGGGSCANGTVFKLVPSNGSWQETILHSFCGQDGVSPIGDVILDEAGNIYGTTGGGLSCSISCGTVFRLAASGAFRVLYTFTGGDDGASPTSGVIRDKFGNLYGTTYLGGVNAGGVVYKISNSGKFSVIYSFCSISNCADGENPLTGLVQDSTGHLYGTTYIGGTYGLGVVFELSQSAGNWSETVLHSFAGSPNDGAGPEGGGLTITSRKIGTTTHLVLFGATAYGGTSGYNGTVFELVQAGGGYRYEVIYNFTGITGADGVQPYGSLTISRGALVGTTTLGGDLSCFESGSGCGTVFELINTGEAWTKTVLYEFTGIDGYSPLSGIVADSSGNLFGVTYSGGSQCSSSWGCGVVFEITP